MDVGGIKRAWAVKKRRTRECSGTKTSKLERIVTESRPSVVRSFARWLVGWLRGFCARGGERTENLPSPACPPACLSKNRSWPSLACQTGLLGLRHCFSHFPSLSFSSSFEPVLRGLCCCVVCSSDRGPLEIAQVLWLEFWLKFGRVFAVVDFWEIF